MKYVALKVIWWFGCLIEEPRVGAVFCQVVSLLVFLYKDEYTESHNVVI